VLVRFVSANDSDLWLVDLRTGIGSRFTHEKGMERDARWLPDGSRVVFRSNRDGHWRTYWKAADGSGIEQVVAGASIPAVAKPMGRDGRSLGLVVQPDRQAGHTVIRDWTSLLGR
jgi:Tol biopolymer transport system component